MVARAARSAVAARRWALVALTAVSVFTGLATRRRAAWFPDVVATYGGDVLWATMLYCLIALVCSALMPKLRAGTLAIVSLCAAFAVEFSQLLHVEPLEHWRATAIGALVLGQGFLWSDLLCYAIGIAFAASLDALRR